MEFKPVYVFPVILVVMALASVFFLTQIAPFNLVIAAVVFVIAAAMVWRIYYDVSSIPKKQETEDYTPSSEVNSLIKEPPKQSKMKLDDFLKSSPKSFDEEFDLSTPGKEENPFTQDSLKDESYETMKEKALKELKGVIKPKKESKPVKKTGKI
jgi:hypothetical protein